METLRTFLEKQACYIYILLIIPFFIFSYYFIQFSVDDSFITYRYAHTFVNHGIWNWGATTSLVEAYTNFSYAVLSILPMLWGMAPNLFFKIFGVIILVGMLLVMRRFAGSRIHLLLGLALLTLSPWFYVHLYSGLETPLFVALIFIVFLLVEKDGPSSWIYACCLLLPLTRPEGAIYSVGALGLYMYQSDRQIYKDRGVLFIGLIGVIYFVWRIWYFGYLLPNTFYLKSVVGFDLQGIGKNIFSAKLYITSALVLLFFVRNYTFRLLTILSSGVFFLSYAPSSLAMDYASRFAFQVFFPVFLLATQVIDTRAWYKPALLGVIAAIVAMVNISDLRGEARWYAEYFPRLIQSHKKLGLALQPFKDRNYSMVVQDAGLIPYYSEWKTYDIFGLADTEIAHEGNTVKYLETRNPDMILLYGTSPAGALLPGITASFIHSHEYQYIGYTKWFPNYYIFVYLKKGLPDQSDIEKAIAEVRDASDNFSIDWNLFAKLGYLT